MLGYDMCPSRNMPSHILPSLSIATPNPSAQSSFGQTCPRYEYS